MVVTSVALLGVIAGAIGIPVGLVLHRNILSFMGKIASGTNIPPSFFDPISHIMYPLLLLSRRIHRRHRRLAPRPVGRLQRSVRRPEPRMTLVHHSHEMDRLVASALVADPLGRRKPIFVWFDRSAR